MICDNSLLIIKQISCNSKALINNLIDSCNWLATEYKRERDMRRQKIVLNLNSNTNEYTLISMRHKERKPSKE